MTNPTSNFGWQMPTPTDLVTDLPADFEVFGQAVDTDFADLLGGANGYILSKASATDLDFAWIPNDQGDITAVNVTAPITGGGSAGAVTIGVSAASTAAAGVVQLSDSTSTTSSVLASTPTATKSAYDLANTANTAAGAAQTTANAAIPKSTVTTAGDVIYATGSAAVTRLGIGSTGQVLTVAAGVPSWATPSAGLVNGQSNTNNSETTTSTTYTGLSTAQVVTLTTGTKVEVTVTSRLYTNNENQIACMGFAISGATTLAADDTRALIYNPENSSGQGGRISMTQIFTVTAGSNTFTAQFRMGAGAGTARFGDRSLNVVCLN